jgi:hypothetical protein
MQSIYFKNDTVTDRVKTISKFNKTPSVHENWHKLSGLSRMLAARMQMFLSLQKNNFRSGKYIQGFTLFYL